MQCLIPGDSKVRLIAVMPSQPSSTGDWLIHTHCSYSEHSLVCCSFVDGHLQVVFRDALCSGTVVFDKPGAFYTNDVFYTNDALGSKVNLPRPVTCRVILITTTDCNELQRA